MAADAFTPDALDDFARSYRRSSGHNLELDRLVGVLVTVHTSGQPDCTCVLCTPVLADFTTPVDPYQATPTIEAGTWVVETAAAWGIAAGSDPRLLVAAAQHLTFTATDHPEAVGVGIDLNALATGGAHRRWPPAGDIAFTLATALVRHRWEAHCSCILCGPPRLRCSSRAVARR